MPNITISLDEKLLKSGRRYAEKHQECFNLMDRANVNSKGRGWKREELYDV